MNTQALNKKLAEWVGFKYLGRHINYNYAKGVEAEQDLWEWVEGGTYFALPYFPDSLDACFKWLVPKLEALYINYSGDAFYACAYLNGKRQEKIAEAPALALCLAIEKLIDGGKG